ncbi:hypothetical protein B0J17DRAFT_706618 [Rhizoctonia solani]|nr:hypothetical protein B0J17DRAFT_706618 [Rhizoctonia solani]
MAARVGTLDLSISEGHANLCKRILETIINSCLPGVFTRLIVRETSLGPASPRFITPKDKKVSYPIHHRFNLDVSEEQLDDVFLPCTSLQLRGLFFPWTSKVYQGLTELRLSCPGARVEISEQQLVAILKSNAQLRILEFRISIQPSNLVDAEPVVLLELENLVVTIDHEMTLPRFIRLITPGSKVLDVSFHLQNNIDIFVDSPFVNYVREFFSRSKIGQLCVSRIEYSVIIHLLMLAPNVRTLILDNCHWAWGSKYEIQLPVQGGSLDVLYVINSSIYIDDLLELIETYGVQKVVCWRYRQFHGGTEFTCGSLDEALRERESESFPALKVLDSNPVQND